MTPYLILWGLTCSWNKTPEAKELGVDTIDVAKNTNTKPPSSKKIPEEKEVEVPRRLQTDADDAPDGDDIFATLRDLEKEFKAKKAKAENAKAKEAEEKAKSLFEVVAHEFEHGGFHRPRFSPEGSKIAMEFKEAAIFMELEKKTEASLKRIFMDFIEKKNANGIKVLPAASFHNIAIVLMEAENKIFAEFDVWIVKRIIEEFAGEDQQIINKLKAMAQDLWLDLKLTDAQWNFARQCMQEYLDQSGVTWDGLKLKGSFVMQAIFVAQNTNTKPPSSIWPEEEL